MIKIINHAYSVPGNIPMQEDSFPLRKDRLIALDTKGVPETKINENQRKPSFQERLALFIMITHRINHHCKEVEK